MSHVFGRRWAGPAARLPPPSVAGLLPKAAVPDSPSFSPGRRGFGGSHDSFSTSVCFGDAAPSGRQLLATSAAAVREHGPCLLSVTRAVAGNTDRGLEKHAEGCNASCHRGSPVKPLRQLVL